MDLKNLKNSHLWLAVALTATVACGESGSESDRENNADAGAKEKNSSSAGTDSQAGQGGEDDEGTGEKQGTWCGDQKKQAAEQCDDGNNNDEDGCNTLCVFSCSRDDDCDDANPCNGDETCDTKNHVCKSGPIAADGVRCGDGMSCRSGICRDNVCGDGAIFGNEECDDSNTDDADGCTKQCRFTCVSTDPKRDCTATDPCTAPMVCNDEYYVCEPNGSAMADRTDCQFASIKEGWCIEGTCVPKGCGDGMVSSDEECDSGQDEKGNLVPCSTVCTKIECGNGRIDPGEQCDDGNAVKLDGCDSHCKPEIVYRLTHMDLVRGTPPDICVYHNDKNAGEGNAFVNAFAEAINFSGLTLNINQLINQVMTSYIASGGTNALFQALDLDVLTANTPDDEIRLGIYTGTPAKDLGGAAPGVDFPFLVDPAFVMGDNEPVYLIYASLKPGGLIVTTAPADVTVKTPVGLFHMYNLTSRSTLNLNSATPLSSPPTVIADVQVPRYMGDDPNIESVICGAISTDSLEQIGLNVSPPADVAGVATDVAANLGIENDMGISVAMLLAMCCWDPAVRQAPYKGCDTGDISNGPDKNCDNFLDLMKGGCDAYVNGCGNGGEHHPIIYPTEPDVDRDNDGIMDAYSGVIGIKGTRAKIVGVKASQ